MSTDQQEAKLQQILNDNAVGHLWNNAGIKKSMQDAYDLGSEAGWESRDRAESYAGYPSESVQENFNTVSTSIHTVYDKKSMDLIDGALKLTAQAKTSEDRRDILQKYAREHGVSEQDLWNAISQQTGSDYFSKDDYAKGTKFDHFDESKSKDPIIKKKECKICGGTGKRDLSSQPGYSSIEDCGVCKGTGYTISSIKVSESKKLIKSITESFNKIK